MNVKFQTNHWIKTHADLALDLIRIYLGIGLVIKAVYFMYHMDALTQLMDTMGSMWFAPAVVAHYIILAHLVGGACLTFGFLTRAAALIQLPILGAAVLYIHMPNMLISLQERQNAEFAGLVLLLLALFSVYGAGRWSMDHWLGKREFEKLFEPEAPAAKPG